MWFKEFDLHVHKYKNKNDPVLNKEWDEFLL